MPKRETAPLGAPCWVDLLTSDADRSRSFYSELFGWKAEEPAPEFGGYFMFSKDTVPVAGAMTSEPGSGMPDAWMVHLATDDARKTVETAEANGGQVIVPPMDVGDVGTMSAISDPGGAAIGAWQPKQFQGFGILGEASAPSWFELQTRDYEGSLAFYKQVFGWETRVVSDTPEFRYTILVNGDDMLAGVADASAFLPAGVPAYWSVYFGVDDADGALARIVDLGGSIERPAEDTPYGRLAMALDATGARFKLVAPNEAMPARNA